MAWDDTKATSDLLTASEWNAHVTDQKFGKTISTLTPSASITLTPTASTIFTLTPDQSADIAASSVPSGQVIYLIVTTSGTSSYTLTFTTNFKTTGTLATGTVSGKVFVMTFVSNGTNFNEVSRTAAM